jgi:hypothetical protein
MLKFFQNYRVRRLCSGVDEDTRIEDLEELGARVRGCLGRLDDRTCHLVETALRSCNPKASLFRTPDILKLASDLPCDHPGWRLLSLMVERTGFDSTLGQGNNENVLDVEVPATVERLGRIKDRLVGGEFTVMRPCAIVVWVKSRQKIFTPHCDEVAFPANWKQIMLHDIQSPALSILETSTRYLLAGDVEYVFSQIRAGYYSGDVSGTQQ